ncbi:hypothetical protein VPG91_00725 [Nitrospirillum amazonense]|uniref:hypothetical protein n=1 Tax=Nitrospirillum amazonense TaxID=28077 RepID=UPI002DD43BC7|nr:hypothetical protein [Nitrospirillum amazonense]MEC4589499.1 hypothetical protein [Nitrospirillum amazonense]
MASGCGAWDEVERQFTLPRYQALWRYWRRNPPVHLMVAAYLGIKSGGPPPADETGLADLLAMFGEGNIC